MSDREAALLAKYADACRHLGIGHVYDRFADADTPADRLVRGVLGAVALMICETEAES